MNTATTGFNVPARQAIPARSAISTSAAAAAASSAADDRNATRSTRIVRRLSSRAAACIRPASASACPAITIVAIPRTRSRNRACNRAIAANCCCDAAAAPIPASAMPTGTSNPPAAKIPAATGSTASTTQATSKGAAQASVDNRQPPREIPVQSVDLVHRGRHRLAG